MDNFYRALNIVFELEGGYSADYRDPGGETKYGISKRSFPEIDIPNLTQTEASNIYKKYYWDPLKCEQLPWPLCAYLFDMGINSGNIQAIKTLQKTLNLNIDGIIGDKTIATAIKITDNQLWLFLAARAIFYMELKNFTVYGQGWLKRLFQLQQRCILQANP